MLHVDINHVNIFIMSHVSINKTHANMIYLACRGQTYAIMVLSFCCVTFNLEIFLPDFQFF